MGDSEFILRALGGSIGIQGSLGNALGSGLYNQQLQQNLANQYLNQQALSHLNNTYWLYNPHEMLSNAWEMREWDNKFIICMREVHPYYDQQHLHQALLNENPQSDNGSLPGSYKSTPRNPLLQSSSQQDKSNSSNG